MSTARRRRLRGYLLSAAAFFMAVGLFLLLYRYDNKYTAPGPQGHNGVLLYHEQAMEEYPVVHLVHGWELYSGVLLTPERFQGGVQPRPDHYVYIGQYAGLEADDPGASPHGSASYRLTIALPKKARTYTLALGEIFSACRVYVNGELLAAMGEVEKQAYRPETGELSVSFEAGGSAEILIAATDYTHLYSGMVYPPVFGLSAAVGKLTAKRLALRMSFCTAAAVVGALALLVGLASRRYHAALLYGLLCLCFLGYAGYPIWNMFLSGYSISYAIENTSFCAMLLLALLLARRIGALPLFRGRGAWAVYIGIGMCLFAAVTHLLLPLGSLRLMNLYSYAVMLYQWLAAASITYLAVRALQAGGGRSMPLLLGILVFDCALVMDRLRPAFEPILTGWFLEIASFALIVLIGVSIGMEIALQYRERTVLADRARRAEQVLSMQRTYQIEIEQQVKEAQAARHDLRHHFRAISSFQKAKAYDALGAYLAQYEAELPKEPGPSLIAHATVNVLAQYYTYLAKQNGTGITLRVDMEAELSVSDIDLVTILSNLLENAIEACLRVAKNRRFIELSITQRSNTLAIYMENSAEQSVMKEGMHVSSKAPDRIGYGLMSIRDTAQKYDGEVTFLFDEGRNLFSSGVVLRLEQGIEDRDVNILHVMELLFLVKIMLNG